MALIDTITGAGFVGEPWGHTPAASLAVGAVYIIGAYGDVNPGRVLVDTEVANHSEADDIYVALTLTDAVTAGGLCWLVPAGKSCFVPGAVAQLVVCNPTASSGAVPFSVLALKTNRALPDVIGGHPGHGEHVVRIVAVQNDEAEETVKTVRATVYSSFCAYSDVENTSALGGVTLTIEAGGNNLLADVPYDLEAGITPNVLDEIAQTATAANLSLAAGADVTITVDSTNADMVEGDLAIGLRYLLP